jgi:uncharacterized cupredoxin-like copper-binding protein
MKYDAETSMIAVKISVLLVAALFIITVIFVCPIYHILAQSLQITTNKQAYKLGETVVITIKNNGKYPLEFPDSLLGLKMQNTKTGQKAGLLASQVMSQLSPNQSKTIQWDQRDIDGKQVQPGTYNARTSLAASNSSSVPPVAASTSFAIKGNAK